MLKKGRHAQRVRSKRVEKHANATSPRDRHAPNQLALPVLSMSVPGGGFASAPWPAPLLRLGPATGADMLGPDPDPSHEHVCASAPHLRLWPAPGADMVGPDPDPSHEHVCTSSCTIPNQGAEGFATCPSPWSAPLQDLNPSPPSPQLNRCRKVCGAYCGHGPTPIQVDFRIAFQISMRNSSFNIQNLLLT